MQPTTPAAQNSGMPIQQPFTDQHNAVYNTLRNQMMQYAAAGVPGMQDVVNGLNKVHTNLMGSYVPTQQQPAQQQIPSATNPAAMQTPQGLAQVRNLMSMIRQRNAPSTPQAPSQAQPYQA